MFVLEKPSQAVAIVKTWAILVMCDILYMIDLPNMLMLLRINSPLPQSIKCYSLFEAKYNDSLQYPASNQISLQVASVAQTIIMLLVSHGPPPLVFGSLSLALLTAFLVTKHYLFSVPSNRYLS